MLLPSPPQRRLSRSSIDLRDLEQQSHEKVPHTTDSAPSIIINDYFPKESNQYSGKSNYSLQRLIKEEDPLARSSIPAHQLIKSSKRTDLDILRDNGQLARFIEDNFCYFKKQNTTPADEFHRNVNGGSNIDNLNMTAMSETDFEIFQRQTITLDDKSNIKQNDNQERQRQLSACSDSDFMVTSGKRRKHPLITLSNVKSHIGFAKNMLTPTLTPTASQTKVPPNNIRLLQSRNRGKRNVLSRSCNECYVKKSTESAEVSSDVRTLQRVLSEGGNTKNTNELCEPKQQWTTVDIFLQLICDSNKTTEDTSNSVLPQKHDNKCRDQMPYLNMNDHCDNKHNSPNELSTISGNASSNNSAPATAKFYEHISKSDQQVIVNRCTTDETSPNNNIGSSFQAGNLRDNRTKSEHIFVNSVIVNVSTTPKAIFNFSPDETPYAMNTPTSFSSNIPTVALVPPISPNNLLTTPSDRFLNINNSLVIPNEHAVDKTNGRGHLLKKETNRAACGHISVVTYAVSVPGSTNEINGNETTYGSTDVSKHMKPNNCDQRGRPSTSSTSKKIIIIKDLIINQMHLFMAPATASIVLKRFIKNLYKLCLLVKMVVLYIF